MRLEIRQSGRPFRYPTAGVSPTSRKGSTLASADGAARGPARRSALARSLAWLLVLGPALGTVVLFAHPVAADQNPPGCTQNNLALDIGRDKTIVRNGDTIVYTISAANLDSAQGLACNLTGTTFTFVAPAADGTPTGARTVLRSGIDFPAGTTRTVLGQVPYVVAVNPGVTDTVAQATATGVLHDAPINDQANVMKTLGSTVTQPHTTLAASVTLTGTAPPLTAVYLYLERNDSSTPAQIASPTVTDDACSPVVYASGDTNGNHILDPGETWAFLCSRRITQPGTYVSHVSGAGVNLEDHAPEPPESAQVTMAVLAAKALPATSPFKGPIPVTGPAVPVGPAAVLAVALIATGGALIRRRSAH